MTKRGRTWTLELTVVGMRFRWKKEGRELLARSVPFPVELEREPDNRADENAVKVNIAGDFKLTKLRGRHLGYLRANIAELFAPKLDAGTVESVKLWVTDIDVDGGQATIDARFRDIPPKRENRSTKRKTGRKVKSS